METNFALGEIDVINMTRIQNRSNECSPENASVSALNTGPVSSFKFTVTSEEGINLVVDLNSSLEDWRNRLENSIRTCQCLEGNKFQSFREEIMHLGNSLKQTNDSFLMKSNSRIKDSDGSINSSVNSFTKEINNSLLNHANANKGPLEIFAAEACSFAEKDSKHLGQQQREYPISISSSSEVKGMNSSPRPEEMKSMDPNAFRVPRENITSCSTSSLAADGQETTLDRMNMKLHDTACSSFVNDPLLNLIDAARSAEAGHEELANSDEIENHAHLIILPEEEQASPSPITRRNPSCQLQEEAEEFLSGGRKRNRYNSTYGVSLQSSGRVLRSAVRPRRSNRLVPKGVAPF